MAFGPLWSQFLLLFEVSARTHTKARTHFGKFSATLCPPLRYFQNLFKTNPRPFGLYYIYLSYITSKIWSSKFQQWSKDFSQNPPHRVWRPSIPLFNHYWVPFSEIKVLVKGAVKYQDGTASVTDKWMSMEQWRNDNDGGNPKYAEKNLSQCHFVHHKSHKHREWKRCPLRVVSD
jgi:hypothetical protein